MTTLGVFGVCCTTLLASLVLVLRHLSAMRARSDEVAGLRGLLASALGARDEAISSLRADLNNEKTKLTQLSNRVR